MSMDEDITGIAQLWVDFKSTRTRDSRDRLIVHYSPLVKYVAGRVAVGLPQNIEQSDLVSYGVFGLIDAIEKFDTSRNIKFETYAIARIKGAIIDELRSIDWVPRSVRAKARSVEKAYSKLEARLLRTPTDVEIACRDGNLRSRAARNLQPGFVCRHRCPRRDVGCRWRARRSSNAG